LLVPALLAWPLLSGAAAEEFNRADIFFELNATDRDVGPQLAVDADRLIFFSVDNPLGRTILKTFAQGKLGTLGVNELALEGEEPSLLEVSFRRLLALFPPGDYRFRGLTATGERLRSTDALTAELPCPVRIVSPPEDDATPIDNVVISWQPAPGVFDPDRQRCDRSRDVGLVGYQVIVGIENDARNIDRDLVIDLPPSVTSVRVPPVFLAQAARFADTEYEVEVLAIEDSGNRTITEQSFDVED
jgi:hypothetical protein